MEYRVLIIKNRLSLDISDAVFYTKSYFAQRTPLSIIIETRVSDVPVDIGGWGIKDKDGVELIGIKGLREHLKTLGVNGVNYNAIVFAYDPSRTVWWNATENKSGGFRHWCHWEAYEGSALIEVGVRQEWGLNDVYRVMTHEHIHGFHQASRLNGNPTIDTMDLYDKEMETDAVNGNRARNLNEIEAKKAWEQVVSQPLLMKLVNLLRLQIQLYQIKQAEKTMSPKIEAWALAIRTHEGWWKGTRSYRNNNPGNFKINPSGYKTMYGKVGEDEKHFAIFSSYAIGWLYLTNFLKNAMTGVSLTYNAEAKRRFNLLSGADLTLEQFFIIYCEDDPLTPENDPIVYAQAVGKKIGVPVTTRIRDLA